uniref:Uncharacterized protein n=1 Tax=Acrobeloides nanus TaxID=290746 RepID=A0A914BWK5_9BILA
MSHCYIRIMICRDNLILATAELHYVNDSTHQYENGSFAETESPQSDTNTESNHDGKTTIEPLYEKQIPN